MLKLKYKHKYSTDLYLGQKEFFNLLNSGDVKNPKSWEPVLSVFNWFEIKIN